MNRSLILIFILFNPITMFRGKFNSFVMKTSQPDIDSEKDGNTSYKRKFYVDLTKNLSTISALYITQGHLHMDMGARHLKLQRL